MPLFKDFSPNAPFVLSHRGFSLIYSDGILIDGMTVKGYTDTLKYITTPTNRQKICSRADWSHEGVRMMTKKHRYGETDPNRGLRLKNVVFSDFGKFLLFHRTRSTVYILLNIFVMKHILQDKNTNSCKLGSWPMAFSDIRTDSHFDYTTSLENVTVLDSRGLFIDACTASLKYGVDDIVLHDLDGSLVASISGTSPDNETSGVFVSNTDSMKFSGCIEYASNCLSYCPDICLRTVTYAVEQFGTEGFNLLVTSERFLFFANSIHLIESSKSFHHSIFQMIMVTHYPFLEKSKPEIIISFHMLIDRESFLHRFHLELTLHNSLMKKVIKFGQPTLKSYGSQLPIALCPQPHWMLQY